MPTPPSPLSKSGAIFVIHPHVREVLVAADRGEDFCAMYELKGDAEVWIQVTSDQINMAYPFDDEPTARIEREEVGGHEKLALALWEPNTFATFDYDPDASSLDVAALVDQLFVRVLRVDRPRYALATSIFPVATTAEDPS